jgi:hypothetical protein
LVNQKNHNFGLRLIFKLISQLSYLKLKALKHINDNDIANKNKEKSLDGYILTFKKVEGLTQKKKVVKTVQMDTSIGGMMKNFMKEMRQKKQLVNQKDMNNLDKLKAWAETKRIEAQKKAEEQAELVDVPVDFTEPSQHEEVTSPTKTQDHS